ncbi:MAG: hypothetical protein ACEPOZ_01385 [Marinifilaceae bacterium]
MDNRDDFLSQLDALMALPREQVKSPNMPVKIYLQEALNLLYYAEKDRAILQKSGLDLSLVETLPVRINALRYAQTEWNSERYELDAAEQEWKQELPRARQFKRELLHNFRFAYRKNEERMKVVNYIAQGRSHADMVQDFCELAVVGRAHPEPLLAIGMDLELLSRAADLSVRLGALLAAVKGARGTLKEAKLHRDRAYTYLKQAVDEVREYGRFVFRGQESKQLHYGSKYFRNLRAELRKKALKEH